MKGILTCRPSPNYVKSLKHNLYDILSQPIAVLENFCQPSFYLLRLQRSPEGFPLSCVPISSTIINLTTGYSEPNSFLINIFVPFLLFFLFRNCRLERLHELGGNKLCKISKKWKQICSRANQLKKRKTRHLSSYLDIYNTWLFKVVYDVFESQVCTRFPITTVWFMNSVVPR